jgi:hypothetical protein
MIEQRSLGLTRRINILADKALLAAFSSGNHQIGPKEMQAAIRDCEFSDATYGGMAARKARTLWLSGVFVAGVLAVIIWLTVLRTDTGVAARPSATSPPLIAAPSPTAPSVFAGPSPTPSSAKVMPRAAAATMTDVGITAPPRQATMPNIGPLTRERLAAGHGWLEKLPDDRWFIQVFATNANQHAEVEALLRMLSSSQSDMINTHVYYSELSGKPRFGVTYGDYPTWAAASAAIHELPSPLRANNPYPRMIARLR